MPRLCVIKLARTPYTQHRRSEPDIRGGYSWSVTFLEYMGDVPYLVAQSDLIGYAVTIDVVEVRKIRQVFLSRRHFNWVLPM